MSESVVERLEPAAGRVLGFVGGTVVGVLAAGWQIYAARAGRGRYPSREEPDPNLAGEEMRCPTLAEEIEEFRLVVEQRIIQLNSPRNLPLGDPRRARGFRDIQGRDGW